jgi:hypothetical protein
MNISTKSALWSLASLYYIAALFVGAHAADPCRDESHNVNSAVQQFRAATRDVVSSCTKDSGDCVGAKVTAVEALDQLSVAQQTLLTVCVGTTPPPPPAEPPTIPGDIVITEFMANPLVVSDSVGEWFEVHNPTSTDFDLNGLVVGDNGADSFTIDATLILPAGGFVVLGNNGDTTANGGVTLDFVYSDFILGALGDEIQILNGTTLLDEIAYTNSFIQDGQSRELSTSHFNATDNDDESNWCDGTALFGDGGLGTPGVTNDCQL